MPVLTFAAVIFTVVGAGPNFMKAAPLHAAFDAAGVQHALVHTGQHYDAAMSKVFFEDLGMPRPLVDLGWARAATPSRPAR
jgi:UDP-N-acetylglucosamine 2-epimerase